MNKSETYYFLGRILSLDLVPENKAKVEQVLKSGQVNWNGFVKLCSDNMMLPAVYINLQRHLLNKLLPPELDIYLAEILELNRIRNKSIIKQVHYVHDLLQNAGIDCILMKGSANLLDALYGDTGERMMYDIDILTEQTKMLYAAEILQTEGFITQKPFNISALKSTMHYPILLREDCVAGIEIHCKPSQYLYELKFKSETLFSHKTPSSMEKGFNVMGIDDRIIHNFLHSQLMHNGHYHADVSLRDLYDLLLLGKKADLKSVFKNYGHFRAKSLAYLKLMYTVFDLEMPHELHNSRKGCFLITRHKAILGMSEKTLKRYHLILILLEKYLVLPFRIIWNKKARNYVFSRLTDNQWYKRHFDAIRRKWRSV
jgi:hypothetical protein